MLEVKTRYYIATDPMSMRRRVPVRVWKLFGIVIWRKVIKK